MRARHESLTERLTFFSDAVFAIALTLLVIEVRPPHLTQFTDVALREALLEMTPQYVGVLVSFFVISRFWIGHHRAFGLVHGVTPRVVAANLMLLCSIAFLPFPTAIVSEYAMLRTGVAFYAIWLIVVGLLNWRLMRLLLNDPALIDDDADPASVRATMRGSRIPVVIGVLALGAGLVSPLAALIPLIGAPVIGRLIQHDWRRGAS